MKLITEIVVDHFRSIRNQRLQNLGDLTALAGLNNSGKSNLLRALHAFFNNQTDAGVPFDFERDYYCHDWSLKKPKYVSVTVRFDLPETFRFRRELSQAEQLLGRTFTLKKLWTRKSPAPIFYLNDADQPLSIDQQVLVEQFLSLIAFRYVPNRVMPLDIIRNEHRALRDVLIRRLAKKAANQSEVFKSIESTSANLIKALRTSVHTACPDVGSIRLATPLSWQDLIFAFGYKLKVQEAEIDDTAQGSGIQSLLMFETLSLIDRDYFQRFGWRQAAIWAVEEPESSLHSSLEARVADYLRALSVDAANRLQILCTTHSDYVLRSSDRPVLATLAKGETGFSDDAKASVLSQATRLGISRWTHPLLCDPLHPLILVEGKHDCAFLEQALKLIAPQESICVSYLERIQGGDATGGDKHLQQYLKAHSHAVCAREPAAPAIALFDWDSAKKVEECAKPFAAGAPFRALAWPDTSFNPRLGRSFHGIERHMSDRIITAADQEEPTLAQRRDGGIVMPRDADYDRFKAAVHRVVLRGINDGDLLHVRDFIVQLIGIVQGFRPAAP